MKCDMCPHAGITVFLSASKPARDLEQYRLLGVEIDEAVVSLSRAIFSVGGKLVFGGHPSISPLVASVATEYGHAADRLKVLIYQSEAYRCHVPQVTVDFERLGVARIIWTPEVEGERFDPSVVDRTQCSASLRLMRKRMLQDTLPKAMVAIGGMEGVEEEARMFVSICTGNVYVLQMTGGAAANLPSTIPEKRIRVLDHFLPPVPFRPDTSETSFLAPYPYIMQKMIQELTSSS